MSVLGVLLGATSVELVKVPPRLEITATMVSLKFGDDDGPNPGGMRVLYLCAQLAVLYTYNCLLILIYYRLGQNQLIINKYAVRSLYSLWPMNLVKD